MSSDDAIDLRGQPADWPERLRRVWSDAVAEAAASDDAFRTPRAGGEPALVDRIRAVLGLTDEHVVITSGVRSSLPLLVSGRRSALIEQPTFREIPTLLRSLVGDVQVATWRQMAAAVARRDADVFWVTAPFRNPDGAPLPESLAVALRDAADDVRVVVNETYRWYGNERPLEVPGALRVGGFSKLLGGGARLGWVVSGEQLPAVDAILPAPPTQWQLAFTLFLDRVTIGELHQCFVAPVDEARSEFVAALARSGLEVPNWGGPSVSVCVQDEVKTLDLLGGAGVLAGAGRHFVSPSPAVRFAFTSVPVERAIEAAARVASVLR